MPAALEIAVTVLILAGAFFMFVGSYGLAKLPDMMRRLHGPTKATTLGVGAILVASMLDALLVTGDLSMHELLIAVFLFLTAPVTANMIAKAYILRNRAERAALPPTGRPAGWATLVRGEVPPVPEGSIRP
ncbi:Na+/H+ antiporter subunit G [Crenalkalicoccus roseus]|uniref:Na+/H+ antiporter subunit G n=1 Tax=Crenalkalicoccus roseus TaxID=1485588 RepID=UPI001080FBE2|nr:Na+/H+ antiporter subunit G [Crenalkalicoccus roseus]